MRNARALAPRRARNALISSARCLRAASIARRIATKAARFSNRDPTMRPSSCALVTPASANGSCSSRLSARGVAETSNGSMNCASGARRVAVTMVIGAIACCESTLRTADIHASIAPSYLPPPVPWMKRSHAPMRAIAVRASARGASRAFGVLSDESSGKREEFALSSRQNGSSSPPRRAMRWPSSAWLYAPRMSANSRRIAAASEVRAKLVAATVASMRARAPSSTLAAWAICIARFSRRNAPCTADSISCSALSIEGGV